MNAKLTVQYSSPASWDFTEELAARLLRLSVLNHSEQAWRPVPQQRWMFELSVKNKDIALELKSFLENLAKNHQRPMVFCEIESIE